jgi:hypothetical protein
MPLNEQAYLETLADIAVYEASGSIDFEAMAQRIDQLLG